MAGHGERLRLNRLVGEPERVRRNFVPGFQRAGGGDLTLDLARAGLCGRGGRANRPDFRSSSDATGALVRRRRLHDRGTEARRLEDRHPGASAEPDPDHRRHRSRRAGGEYASASTELARVTHLPWLVMPGNHDDPDRLARMLPSTLPIQSGPRRYDAVCRLGGATIIALDSTRPPRPHGVLDAVQLTWLQKILANTDGAVLVAMHHPPFVTGMSAMDAVGLEAGVDELQALLERREDCLFVCGHVHRTIVTRIGAATAIAALAMGFQSWLDLTDGRPALISTESGGFLLQRLEAGARPITHIIQTSNSGRQKYP